MDRFYEQMTPAYKSSLFQLFNFLMVFMIVICAITITIIIPVGILAGVIALLLYFLKQKEYVEYEYIFTNGSIDVDLIIAASKRKRLMSFDIKEVDIMAPQGSMSLDGSMRGKKVSAYPKDTKEKVFIAVIHQGKEVKELHFIPDEEFVNLCFRSNPKNVKKA